MNDKVKIGFYYDTETEMNKVLQNGIFENRKKDISRLTGEPITICKMRNLQTTFYHQTKYVRLTGSLIQLRHSAMNKTYASPANYANCTHSDIHFVTDYISSIFAMPKKEMKISGMEFSLTAAVPENPKFYIYGLNSFRLNPFYYLPPPRNHSEPLEKYCPRSQYTAKCYNWGAWNEVKGNFLRWEISFRKMQPVKRLTGRRIITLADLTDNQFQRNMANFALKILQDTDKRLLIDYSVLKPRQREFLFAGANPEYWKEEKKINPNTAKKKRAAYLHLYKQMAGEGLVPYHDLENLLKSKFDYLLSN